MTAMIHQVDLISSIHGPVQRDDDADETWRAKSLCNQANSETFFPDVRAKTQAKAAKVICGRCTVAPQCLEFALATGERFGVWGGTTPVERQEIRRRRTRPRTA